MKYLLLVFCLLALSLPARAQVLEAYNGFCWQGGQTVSVSGLTSSTKVQRTYPSGTVTVFLAGTTTPATIYSDSVGTPLANPLTCSSTTASFQFYASPLSRYDLRFAATGLTTYTLGSVVIPAVSSAFGVSSLNSLTGALSIAVGTSGTNFAVSASGSTVTLNLPTASASNRGALSTTDWSTFNAKIGGSGTSGYIPRFTASTTLAAGLLQDDGTNIVKLELSGATAPTFTVSNFGATSPISSLLRGNGTAASPTRVVNANTLGEIDFRAQYDSTVGHTDIAASVYATALESFTSSAYGTVLRLTSAAVGSTDGINGGLGITGVNVRFYNASGGWTALKASATAGNVIFSLPDADGTSGQVLQTNGSGVWSFGSVPGGISGLTANKIPVASSSTTIIDSLITQSSSKIGINQGSPAALLTNASTLITDGGGGQVNASTGLAWAVASANYVESLSNTNNATGSSGLLIGITNTNANSYPINARVGSASAFVITGSKHVWLGTNLGTDFSVGDDTDLHIQSSGTTSATFGLKVDNASFTGLSVRNDGLVAVRNLAIGSSGATITRTLTGTGTVGNGGSNINANTCITDTITVTNAASGDTVVATPPSTIEASFVWAATVTSGGVVTVRLCNPTAGNLASADLTWRVSVLQY